MSLIERYWLFFFSFNNVIRYMAFRYDNKPRIASPMSCGRLYIIFLSICYSIYLTMCLSDCLSIGLTIYQTVPLTDRIWLSECLSVDSKANCQLSVCLTILSLSLLMSFFSSVYLWTDTFIWSSRKICYPNFLCGLLCFEVCR